MHTHTSYLCPHYDPTTSVVVFCSFIPSCYSAPLPSHIAPRFVLFFVAVPGCRCFHLSLLPDLPLGLCVSVGKYERWTEPEPEPTIC